MSPAMFMLLLLLYDGISSATARSPIRFRIRAGPFSAKSVASGSPPIAHAVLCRSLALPYRQIGTVKMVPLDRDQSTVSSLSIGPVSRNRNIAIVRFADTTPRLLLAMRSANPGRPVPLFALEKYLADLSRYSSGKE